eukprot:SAG31_NODE_664_length_12996_cov_4.853997_3_plen_670_part_00
MHPGLMPMLATGNGSDSDARFRSLEKQCADLRQEQRQLAGWLSQSQQKLESEIHAREAAERDAQHLAQQLDAMYSELKGRSDMVERDLQSTHDAAQRISTANQEALSQLGGELNAVSADVESVASSQRTLHEQCAQLNNDVGVLNRLSKTVDGLHERTTQLTRTVEDRLTDVEVKSKAKDDELGSKIEECLRISSGANRSLSQLEQQQQRAAEESAAALRRTETTLIARITEQITGRGREIAEQLTSEAEGRLKREVEQALSTVAKETTSVLRREMDEKLRALTTAVKDSAAERQAHDDRTREDFRALLKQHKDKLLQTADDSTQGFRQLEQALRTETDARIKLETSHSKLASFAADNESRNQQLQQELLAVEESLETGLAQLRSELLGRLEGSMAASEEGDRRRDQDLRQLQVELSTQIEGLRQKRKAGGDGLLDQDGHLSSIAEAMRLQEHELKQTSTELASQRAAVQQLRSLLSQREERDMKTRAELDDCIRRLAGAGVDRTAAHAARGSDVEYADLDFEDGNTNAQAAENSRVDGIQGGQDIEQRLAAVESGLSAETASREHWITEWRQELATVDRTLDTIDKQLDVAGEERHQIAELSGAAMETVNKAVERIHILEERVGEISGASDTNAPSGADTAAPSGADTNGQSGVNEPTVTEEIPDDTE